MFKGKFLLLISVIFLLSVSFAFAVPNKIWIEDYFVGDIFSYGSDSAIFTEDGILKMVVAWSPSARGYMYNGSRWIDNNDSMYGFNFSTNGYAFSSFYYDGKNRIIAGTGGAYDSWYRDDSINTWIYDNDTMTNGLVSYSFSAMPSVFYSNQHSRWEIITSGVRSLNLIYESYYWNGTKWISDNSMSNGIVNIFGEECFEFGAFYDIDNALKGIQVCSLGRFFGYDWNGTYWNRNSSVVTGLSDFHHRKDSHGMGDDSFSIYYYNDVMKIVFFDYAYALYDGRFDYNCTQNWQCSNFSSCGINNISVCLNVSDSNECGLNFTGNLSLYNEVCDYNCTPDWSCNSYASCTILNNSACLSVVDLNNCGIPFSGTLSYYDTWCGYSCSPNWRCSQYNSICNKTHNPYVRDCNTITDSNNCGFAYSGTPVFETRCTDNLNALTLQLLLKSGRWVWVLIPFLLFIFLLYGFFHWLDKESRK